MPAAKFSRAQIVEVRSCAEILATLDAQGKLDGMPFMPEMARYCGGRYAVHRRAERSCVAGSGMRRLHSTVFLLELRCDGAAHGGCQRGCLLFWKEAWLRPVAGAACAAPADKLSEYERRRLAALPVHADDRYICQSTALHAASQPLSRWDIRPLLRDVRWGELSLRGLLALVLRTAMHRLFGWRAEPRLTGTTARADKGDLNLQAGEAVRVKERAQLREHLDARGGNCGLIFQPTMYEAIGGRYRVAFPVTRIILEQSGKMVTLEHTVALDGMTCQGPHAANCPRNEYLYWRECWLQRDTRTDETT